MVQVLSRKFHPVWFHDFDFALPIIFCRAELYFLGAVWNFPIFVGQNGITVALCFEYERRSHEQFHAARTTGARAGAQGSRPLQSQFPRHRTSVARPDQIGTGRRRQRAPKNGPRPRNRPHGGRETGRHRPRPENDREHSLHPAREKSAGPRLQGSQGAQSYLRRHRTHFARPPPRGRRRRRQGAQESRRGH